MKSFLLMTLTVLTSLSASAKPEWFHCSGAPATGWKEYYGVQGTVINSKKLTEVEFGIFEGSSDAGEEEPVNTVTFETLKHDAGLAATSKEWRDASAFDVSSEDLGPATLYIKQETFSSTEVGSIVRLKITVNGKQKDLRLSCGTFSRHL